MGRDLDDQVGPGDRAERFGHLAMLFPLPPQLGLGGRNLRGKRVVEIAQARRVVQVGKLEAADAKGIGGGRQWRHPHRLYP